MNEIKDVISMIRDRLKKLAQSNAVVSRPISVGDRHVLPLCELSMGFGGGGGTGEDTADKEQNKGQGTGGGTAGTAKATPIAVIVVDGNQVRIETLGK
ncbi:sporulation protein YtfJ [delta proteobacterium NaphS2]|nr:sporulation protein YtfJ [delta proteobacterium NaphS2]